MPQGLPVFAQDGDLLQMKAGGAFEPAGFTLRGAYTFTAAPTIDTVGGAFQVAPVTTSLLLLQGTLGNPIGIAGITAGSTALNLKGFGCGGTRNAMTALPDAQTICNFGAFGYDGASWSGVRGQYSIVADGLWAAGSNNGTKHLLTGCLNGATALGTWLILRGTSGSDPSGTLGIGAAPTAGNGLLQLLSGTTKANGIAFGTDCFLFRSAANTWKFGGQNTIQNVQVDGTNAGTNGGAYIGVSNNGTAILYFGNASGILGGAYDATPMFYGAAAFKLNVGATTVATLSGSAFTVNVATASGSTITGAFVCSGGLGVAGRIYAGDEVHATAANNYFGVAATTGTTGVYLDGGNSGTGGGTVLVFRGNGVATGYLGNASAILGGAYDATWLFYAPASTAVKIYTGGSVALTIDTSQNATFAGSITHTDAKHLIFGTTTGSQIGTGATQKLGFWGATPIAQKTGYGTPTGNAQTASFPGATATLLQTAQELAQLLLDLKAAGVIGA